jgi:DNA-binding transcriptional MerR regulator
VEKAPEAFRTISEVADELDIPQHVLRFWESRFREIKPMKRGGGRRYYRPEDVGLLRGIRHLLYGEGYTIRGVQRILKEQGIKFVQSVWQPGAPQLAPRGAEADADVDADETDAEAAPAPSQEARRPVGIVASPPAERREPQLEQRPPAGLGQANARKLQDVLNELSECRRQLDAALGEML